MFSFSKFIKVGALLATVVLAGCQTAEVQPGQLAMQPFQPLKFQLPANKTASNAGSKSISGENNTTAPQSLAQADSASGNQELLAETVALPLAVPVPKHRAVDQQAETKLAGTPFRVPGETPSQVSVAIASLDPSSGFSPTSTTPTNRVVTKGRKRLVGPVRKSRRRVAALTRKRGPVYAKRRAKYEPLVVKHARAAGVPVKLALAVVHVESSFRSQAKGAAGEIGLMQIMPATARYMGYKGSMKKLYHPATNLRVGMKYLAKAKRLGGDNLCKVILKYNAGHGAKRMNPISRKYCKRIRRIMRQGV